MKDGLTRSLYQGRPESPYGSFGLQLASLMGLCCCMTTITQDNTIMCPYAHQMCASGLVLSLRQHGCTRCLSHGDIRLSPGQNCGKRHWFQKE